MYLYLFIYIYIYIHVYKYVQCCIKAMNTIFNIRRLLFHLVVQRLGLIYSKSLAINTFVTLLSVSLSLSLSLSLTLSVYGALLA